MWKAFSRSVCEVVERGIGCTAFRSDVSSIPKPDSSIVVKKPSNGQVSCFVPALKTSCLLKHLRAARIKHSSHEKNGERHQQKNKRDAKWNDPPITACLGAMGWSTALVIGWYLSQPLGRRIFGDAHFRDFRSITSERIVHAQSPIQPLAIYPINCGSSLDETSSAASYNSSFTSSSGDGDVLVHKRGPFTPEEALDEASREFEAASRAFAGDVENKIGMVCMTKGHFSDAVKHFRRASRHEHAVAAYNLGQCYELGLGTAQNLKKAAKWYKIGSDRGHPTAMYNLAVFLANGLGGLHEDHRRARELLTSASSLGLKEAKDALTAIDRESNSDLNLNVKDSTEEFLEMIGATTRMQSDNSGSHKVIQIQTNLSHLDWLDLSSSSSSSRSSEDMYPTYEEPRLYSGLSLEKYWTPSSKMSSSIQMKTKVGENEPFYYVFHNSGSCSTDRESLDEAANLVVEGK